MKKINGLKVFGIIIALFLILTLIGYTVQRDSASFVQRGFDGVRGLVTNVNDLFRTYEENQRLREQGFNEQMLRLQMDQLEMENESLRIALETGKTLTDTDFEIMYATTIERNQEHWHDFLMINKGSEQGVELDMFVLSKEGYLIGRVTRVNENCSRVQLFNRQNTTMMVSAVVDGVEDSIGVLEGYDFTTGELIMINVDRDVEIEEGDKVITSGLGRVSPRGLLIGYVERTERSANGLTQTLYLSSEKDYNNLDFVILVREKVGE